MMNIILDLTFIIVIIACIFRATKRTVYRNVANILVIIAVFVGATLGTLVLKPVVRSLLLEHSYARSAASEMADMVSSPIFDDPYKTVEGIDIPALIEKQPEQFESFASSYNVTSAAVLKSMQDSPDSNTSTAALKAIIFPVASDTAKLLSFGLLFLLLWILFRSIAKVRYEKFSLKVKMTQNVFVSGILGLLSGVLWCFALFSTLIKCCYPYDLGIFSIINMKSGVDSSLIARAFVLFNPF